jgi:2-methylcitrate dehydratase
MEPAYDQPIADIAQYIFHYEIDEADEKVWARARMALLDTLGCAIETAATSDECRKLLGLTSKGMIVPDGFRVPGTDLQVDPLEGAFDFGVLIRYLDHNDALGGAEWGHPSGMTCDTLRLM